MGPSWKRKRKRPLQRPNLTIHQDHQSPLSIPHFHQYEFVRRGSYTTTVYKARHRPTGNLFALKVAYVFSDIICHNIRAESRILSSFNHPNVVNCHGLIQERRKFQFTLDYMDCGSLKGRRITHEPYLANVARQILRGLAYLHGRGIVHHDIKPSNLLIDSHNHVKIADYVSWILTRGIHNFLLAETFAYHAPETLDNFLGKFRVIKDGHYAADIWSLGMSILELYMGKFPIVNYHPDHWTGLLNAICESQPPEVPTTSTTASKEFCHFISCCLQKTSIRRWTAAQLLLHPFITQGRLPHYNINLHLPLLLIKN